MAEYSVTVQYGEVDLNRFNVTTTFASESEALDIALEYARDLINGYVSTDLDPDPYAEAICIDDLSDEGRAVVESSRGSTRAVRWYFWRCPECDRLFTLDDDEDAQEVYYGHDCEAGSVIANADALSILADEDVYLRGLLYWHELSPDEEPDPSRPCPEDCLACEEWR